MVRQFLACGLLTTLVAVSALVSRAAEQTDVKLPTPPTNAALEKMKRLAGTWSAYSGRAISQLTRMVVASGAPRKRRWPYHASVMKAFESSSSTMVRMINLATDQRR